MIPDPVTEAILRRLGSSGSGMPVIGTVSPVSGGSINDAYSFVANGEKYFVKLNSAGRYPGMFEAEAKGLEILRNSGCINVPQVLFCENAGAYSFILMNYAAGSSPKPGFWEEAAQQLANLHKISNPVFGLDHDNYIGSLRQINTPAASWADFLVNARFQPMIKMAGDAQLLNSNDFRKSEQLFSKLGNLIPAEPPALLHGDLWSGNLITGSSGLPCFIDPAVYWGHREIDLAMTRLFGGFPQEFYHSYNQAFPLEKGWQERIDLNQLYPLLVHVNLFGGGYVSQVRYILKRYVG